jgi:hypothetical protein
VIRWLALIGGLLIWAVHFVGVYTIASLADVWWSAEELGARWIAVAFSLACLLATAVVALWVWRRPSRPLDLTGLSDWEQGVGLTGAGVAAISILWQTAPLAF